MGSCCGCCAQNIPAARKPSQRVAAPPRLNPLELANANREGEKGASCTTSTSSDETTLTSSSSSSTSSSPSPSTSPDKSSTGSSNSSGSLQSFDSADIFSVESDPDERARRAAESFKQWRNKEYVPLNPDEKRAIKEYRKTVATEEGTYMSSRAQRPRGDGPRREKTREGECIPLDNPAENYALKRRHSQIRFTQAVAAPVAPDIHNEAVLVPLEDGIEIPALKPTASILSKTSISNVVDDVPFFDPDMEIERSDSDPSSATLSDQDYFP